MQRRWLMLAGFIAFAIAVWTFGFVRDHFDQSSVGHQAIQYWLKMFGESVYEYHAKTGRWPSSVDDFADTALPVRFPLWRETAKGIVFLWPKDLKDDPKQNRSVMLMYYNVGTLSMV